MIHDASSLVSSGTSYISLVDLTIAKFPLLSSVFFCLNHPCLLFSLKLTAHGHVDADADSRLHDTSFPLNCQCRLEGSRTIDAQNKAEVPGQGQIVVRSVCGPSCSLHQLGAWASSICQGFCLFTVNRVIRVAPFEYL